MTDAKFLQIHTLTSYPGTLLNRDDAGFAKRMPFGGATRTRVSSQCLKYHWRNFDGEGALYKMEFEEPVRSIRSRTTFRDLVAKPMIERGLPERLVVATVETFVQRLMSDDAPSAADYKASLMSASSPEEPLIDRLKTNQVTIFGEPELRYIIKASAELIAEMKPELGELWENPAMKLSKEQVKVVTDTLGKLKKGDLKKNIKGMKLASGLDAALFGRMVTSDVLSRGDAAIHVAHAFTVHEEASESDYFAAIDELRRDSGELGGGHINSSELTSGLYYGYTVIDVPLLISNLEGCAREDWKSADRTLAAQVVERFVKLQATVSPGAKLGSTAPYAWAECVLVEAGSAQPRTLANAFRRPVREQPDVLENAYQALGSYVHGIDQMYGHSGERRLSVSSDAAGLADALGVEAPVSLPNSAQWAAEMVKG
ncbi:type I-E CRISPR-associated protein Cas7/Cse4/CasC [Bradymonas sediminis]|uniref:Type I-E CRISPR-associated protein Cas7/Cse4/CasC n=1 Tax=Bradymonas sediminis TaxID=1548548 RepID=A0A2Z4FGX2_9DELT|nr:type I-E CRISPR-associated protein Cas7/Cse4/CasC [Bradymonas sediminis]AWV88251.1 type I-E CRISPR-associated protein Cas7/Cse4/CasC [Bradymonas sediminis]TDP77374.1 CRISPR system Cascade subunit CasC [Bradymonas sediminis]